MYFFSIQRKEIFKEMNRICISMDEDEKQAMRDHREALGDLSRYMRDTVEYQNYDALSDMADTSAIHQKYSNPHLTNRNGNSFKGFYNEITWMHLSEDGRKSVNNLNRAWNVWAKFVKYR
uniref:Uncharacterized protein n=1 Tax=Marseillevirus LCMAC101 TaxID=2506602 RepID=A0A481YSW6_9VIRU|nr:MAG: hypothetical protein LCMAC101_07640 [Marseillevirus LCMAC101]